MDCRICHMSPVNVHHLRTGMGMGQRASHYKTIPLCPFHHQLGGHGIAFHEEQKTWEANFGSEVEHCRATQRLMLDLGYYIPADQIV